VLRFEHVVRDPVHGDVGLTREELRILDTPEMQRLRDVRQLGTAYLVYPGAQHSRFEHSIGTAHLAGRIAAEVNAGRARAGGPDLLGYDEQEVRIVRLAALVHDSTHLPFGHNIEDQTGLLPRHDVPERFAHMLSDETGLGRALAATGVRDEVLGVLAPAAVPAAQQPPAHWRELVAGPLDADLLDYLQRDALFTGLRLQVDPRILAMFRVDRAARCIYVDLVKRGYLREDLLSEVLRCLEMRLHFTERVYYHHAKIAAGALVAKAVELALLHGALDLERLRTATDAGLFDMLSRVRVADPHARERMRLFVECFRTRRLPKRVAVYPAYANAVAQPQLVKRFFGAGSAAERRRVEDRLGEGVRFAVGHDVPVLLYCPSAAMQLKQARVRVRWPGSDGLAPLSERAAEVPRLAELERSYGRLWKFYVFALTNDLRALEALAELCAGEFPGATNVLDRRGRGEHAGACA